MPHPESIKRPPLLLSTTVIVLLLVAWMGIRLFLFPSLVTPVTYVLPLIVCVWSMRRWQVWFMALVFAAKTVAKAWWLLPGEGVADLSQEVFVWSTLFNILVGAVVVHLMILFREALELRNNRIAAQNAELEAQSEELAQQNEELKAQAEELAEQNEEIEAQNEEVARQNEELVDLNARLASREEILEGLLHSFRHGQSIRQMLQALSERALEIVGDPACRIVFLQRHEDHFVVQAQATSLEGVDFPMTWPIAGSIAEIVLRESRTTYVSDLSRRPDLAAPFGPNGSVRSILATPIDRKAGPDGLLVACSSDPAHWTEDQFRILEWIAAQGGLMIQTLLSQLAVEEHATALTEANQAKDRFLAMLSHELRTPLTPVLAIAGTLESDPRLPDDVREDLRMIRHNAGIQSRLIDDLLDLTRINRGIVDLDQTSLSVVQLIQDSARIVSGEIDAKSQELRLDIAAADGCFIRGDGPRLQQVFWNLLKNASKFSPGGGIICVDAIREGARLTIRIRDEGCGVESQDLDRIFLPFEQSSHSNPQGRNGGLGLGLAIAKAIVDLHGGSICAASAGKGRGATFSVTLPVELAEDKSEDSRIGSDDAPNQSDEKSVVRILLVEDHEDTGRIFSRLLTAAGYETYHASTASEALSHFNRYDFDLVVSDIGLPDDSGINLMRKLCEIKPDIKGIALSGYGMEDDVKECYKAGFIDHITKPIEFPRLRMAIQKIVSDAIIAR